MEPTEREGWIKICGVTRRRDVDLLVEAGADAVGFNVWKDSPRYVAPERLERLVEVARGRIDVVLVGVDVVEAQLARWLEELAPDFVQLHGQGSAELVRAFAPRAYEAVGLAGRDDVARATSSAGAWVLVDAPAPRLRGGTGTLAPIDLAREVCRARKTVLAGGLRPENVAERVRSARPWGVDVASGVETAPGQKDESRVVAFVEAARRALEETAEELDV